MTREEVMTTLGVDASTMQQGLGIGRSYVSKWIGNVQEQERGYTGWWNTELKKREEMEVAANIRAASRSIKARQLLRERDEARQLAEAKAQQVANEEISQGSGGYAWMKKAAGATGTAAAGAGAAKALGEVAKEGKGVGGVFRELFVLIRELAGGRYASAVRSSTILAQRLAPMLTRLSTAIPLIGLAIAAGTTAYEAVKAGRASKDYDKSLVKEGDVTQRLAKHLRTDIENIQKSGRISKEVADKYLAILAHPTLGRVTEIAKLLQPVGDPNKHDANEIARLNKENMKKIQEYARENESIENRHATDTRRVVFLQHDLQKLKKGTVEYAQTQLALTEAQHDLDLDNKKIAEDKLDLQRKINEEQKVVDQAKLRINEIEQREKERFMPTLDELSKMGGIGGQTARHILREERRIKREFAHGDIAGANRDLADRNRQYDSLAARGIAPERTELREIQNINKEMNLHLENIAKGTAILKTRLAMG